MPFSAKQGQFIQKNDAQRFTLGIVYEPNVEDTQGDFTDAPEIEKACWKFARKIQTPNTLNKKAAECLESIIKSIDENGPNKFDITEIYEEVTKGGLNDQHVNTPLDGELGDIVENYIAPCDFEVNGEQITKGTWLMGVVWSESYFEKIQNGERNGFSMEGRGKRIEGVIE